MKRLGHTAHSDRSATRTLTPELLAHDAAALVERLLERGVEPTHLIAIASAGLFVASEMAHRIVGKVEVLTLTCRRPTTAWKRWLSPIVKLSRHLPAPALDVLRDWELRYLTPNLKSARVVEMSLEHTGVLEAAAGTKGSQIVVVDDCVDTGASLRASLEHLGRIVGPDTKIYSAVISLTLMDPVVRPDVFLYENVGIRGPWSYDY